MDIMSRFVLKMDLLLLSSGTESDLDKWSAVGAFLCVIWGLVHLQDEASAYEKQGLSVHHICRFELNTTIARERVSSSSGATATELGITSLIWASVTVMC